MLCPVGWPGRSEALIRRVTADVRSVGGWEFTTRERRGRLSATGLSLAFYYCFGIHKAILGGEVNLGRQIKAFYLRKTGEQ